MDRIKRLIFIFILILCVGISNIACYEPACSKFHFEEQLLEKMIRMEFNVGQMKEEMTNMRDVVKKELISMQTERENFKTMFQTLNDEHKQESVLLQTQRENITKVFDDLKVEHKDAMLAQFKDMGNVFKNQKAQIMRLSEDLRILENNTVQKLTTTALPTAVPPPTYGPALAQALYIGARIQRGKDWKWEDQDGNGPGTVTALPPDTADGWVKVLWDNKYSNSYRMGKTGHYDLMFVPGTYNPSSANSTATLTPYTTSRP